MAYYFDIDSSNQLEKNVWFYNVSFLSQQKRFGIFTYLEIEFKFPIFLPTNFPLCVSP
jgi:hypothetical protein